MWGWIKRVSVAVLAVGLVACGGGGDGTSVSSSASALTFQGYVGESIASQNISVTLKEAPGTVYVDYFSENPSIASVNGYLTGERSGVLEVRPGFFSSPGTYRTTVYLNLYSDPFGRSLVASYPYAITLEIRSGLVVSPTMMTLNAAQGDTTGATLALTPAAGVSNFYSASVPPEALPAPWLTTSISGNSVRVTATTAALSPGAYSTELQIVATRGDGGTSVVRIPISLTVGPALIAPARQSLLFDVGSTQSSLAGSVPVVRGDGGAGAWSATTTVPWLVLSAQSGVSPANLGFSVNLDQAKLLKPFSDHTATVTLSSAGSLPVAFDVVLQQRVPYVSFAGPYSVPVGTVSRVILGGKGFTQLTSAASSLQLSGLTAAQVQVISDTQMSMNVTPSTARSYSVSVANAAGLATSQASLVVAPAQTYAPAIVAHEVQKFLFVHDPVRKAIYSISRSNDAVYKFSLVDAVWRVDALALASPASLVLSPDGRTLWVVGDSGSSAGRVVDIDPDTMTVRNTYADGGSFGYGSIGELPITSNNRLWLLGGRYFDLESRTFKTNDASVPHNIGFGTLFGSLDGSLAIFGPSYSFSPRPPAYIYDPARNEVGSSSGGLELGYNASVSADGSRILGNWDAARVFDRSFNVLGQLPAAPTSEFWGDVVLTPDGKKILVVRQQSSGNGLPLSIDVYSTQSLKPGSTEFVRTARVELTNDVRGCNLDGSSCNYGATKLVPSRDSLAVFWFGNRSMQVIPLP